MKLRLTHEPLVVRAAVTGLLTAILHFLVQMGVFPIDADAEDAMSGVLDFVGLMVATYWARRAVTPVVKDSSEEVIHESAPEESTTTSTEGEGL